jgi:hypothetical protein
MAAEQKQYPMSFKLSKWHGYGFAGTFLLFGGVKIILSFLDRTYADIGQSFLFLVVGVLLISVVFAYRDLKAWGWYGLVAINGLVVLGSLFGLTHYENVVLLLLSLASLTALFMAPTKGLVLKGR